MIAVRVAAPRQQQSLRRELVQNLERAGDGAVKTSRRRETAGRHRANAEKTCASRPIRRRRCSASVSRSVASFARGCDGELGCDKPPSLTQAMPVRTRRSARATRACRRNRALRRRDGARCISVAPQSVNCSSEIKGALKISRGFIICFPWVLTHGRVAYGRVSSGHGSEEIPTEQKWFLNLCPEDTRP